MGQDLTQRMVRLVEDHGYYEYGDLFEHVNPTNRHDEEGEDFTLRLQSLALIGVQGDKGGRWPVGGHRSEGVSALIVALVQKRGLDLDLALMVSRMFPIATPSIKTSAPNMNDLAVSPKIDTSETKNFITDKVTIAIDQRTNDTDSDENDESDGKNIHVDRTETTNLNVELASSGMLTVATQLTQATAPNENNLAVSPNFDIFETKTFFPDKVLAATSQETNGIDTCKDDEHNDKDGDEHAEHNGVNAAPTTTATGSTQNTQLPKENYLAATKIDMKPAKESSFEEVMVVRWGGRG